MNTIQKHCNDSFPLIQRPNKDSHKDTPWITPALKVSINGKNNLFAYFKRRPTLMSNIRYTHYEKNLSALIKESKQQYYDTRITEHTSNSKDFWDSISSRMIKQQLQVLSTPSLQTLVRNWQVLFPTLTSPPYHILVIQVLIHSTKSLLL